MAPGMAVKADELLDLVVLPSTPIENVTISKSVAAGNTVEVRVQPTTSAYCIPVTPVITVDTDATITPSTYADTYIFTLSNITNTTTVSISTSAIELPILAQLTGFTIQQSGSNYVVSGLDDENVDYYYYF